MSVDLLIFGSPARLSSEAAAEIYARVCDGRHSGLEPDARIAEFHRDLLDRFPALESLSDDDLSRLNDFDHVIWSMTPVATQTHVMISIMPSRAHTVEPVLALAAAHSLACYDPQARRIHEPVRPTDSGGRQALRFKFCDGTSVNGPDPRDIRSLLGGLSAQNWFAVLQGEDGSYVQVGLGQRAGGVPVGSYAVEYRDDPYDDDSHFRAIVGSLDDVVTVFSGYAAGEQSWKTALPWKPALAF